MATKLIVSYLCGIITSLLINYFRRNKRKLVTLIMQTRVFAAEKDKIKQSVYKDRGNVITELALSEQGEPVDNIIAEIHNNYIRESKYWCTGGMSGSVYYNFDSNEQLCNLISTVYRYTFLSNPMHLSSWPSIVNQEVQIVRWIAYMYHGNKDVVGVMTGGGSDSIMEACLTYRKLAEKEFNICDPVIIIPSSAHVSFLKAGDDHCIEIIVIPVDEETRCADIIATEMAIKRYSKRVIALVGSAPSYGDGVVDDIEALAQLAFRYSSICKRKIGIHVDCCLGSFVIPFTEERFDFAITEVTSISVDTHKFGNAPKGGSVLLYRNLDIAKYQMRIYTEWQGGLYPTPTRLGSRNGGVIACTYAVIKYFGLSRYRQFAKDILATANMFRDYVKYHPDLELVGHSRLMVVAFKFRQDKYNIYQLAELLKKKYKWELNKLQHPSHIHMCFTHVHTRDSIVYKLISAINLCIQECKDTPDVQTGDAAMYCTLQRVPKDMAKEAVLWYQEAAITPILQDTQ